MDTNRINRYKAWCFDNGYTEQDVIDAWDKGLQESPLIRQLQTSGVTYQTLAPHLLTDLMKRYGS